MSLPKLQYFAFRGRALASRVALFNALGKDGWVDEKISLPRFKKAQPFPMPDTPLDRIHKAEYITNNLPQLVLPCGLKVSQSHAIARYAAKLGNIPDRGNACDADQPIKLNQHQQPAHRVAELYPSDPEQALLVDEAIAVIDQILLLTPKDEDEEVRARNRVQFYTTGFLRVGMELLEARLATTAAASSEYAPAPGPFLLGSQLSLADLYIRAPLGDLFDLKQFEGVPVEFYDEFPHVQACAAAVLVHPLLKEYRLHYKV